ncbi:hypothetical protein L1049_006692 [Liquidambar formosana]|uniref:Uncharacterized protein n=1 Tax=Liquidambar formosana TaxID=63359 RepID=A0AAP0RHP5_LIQFO
MEMLPYMADLEFSNLGLDLIKLQSPFYFMVRFDPKATAVRTHPQDLGQRSTATRGPTWWLLMWVWFWIWVFDGGAVAVDDGGGHGGRDGVF